jgi:hypothetical protein
MRSLFVVEHPAGTSREVAMTEALAADRAIEALGLKVVAGAYAQPGDACATGLDMLLWGKGD